MKELDICKDETIYVIENPSDCGNCKFASVAHQLLRFRVFRSAHQLRLEAIQHIQTWRDHYEGFEG